MSLIGVRELRERTSEVIRRVREERVEYVDFCAQTPGAGRVISRYMSAIGIEIYVITESDRSRTTVCLVSEF